MKRTGYALLLVASTLSAQSKPPQLFPPRSTQNSVTKQVLDAVKLPLNFPPAKLTPAVMPCAIPLLNVPVPAGNFTIKRVTPVPTIDPKMVVKPPLPACAEKPAVSVAPVQTLVEKGK